MALNHTGGTLLVRHSQTHFLRLKLNPSSLAGVRSKRACSYLSDFPINSLHINLCYSLPHYSHSSFATPPHLLAPSCLIFSSFRIEDCAQYDSSVCCTARGCGERDWSCRERLRGGCDSEPHQFSAPSTVAQVRWCTHCACCCHGNTMYTCK